ncbi:MAG: hypothetical protein WDN31_06845 [Hyphomicrobium sp.]
MDRSSSSSPISTDISAIREQARTLQAMIEYFPGGLALIDRECVVIASNKLYRTLLEMPEELFASGPPKLETLVRVSCQAGRLWPDAGRGGGGAADADAAQPGAADDRAQ